VPGQDPQAVLAALGEAKAAATVTAGPAVRVAVEVRLDDGTRANADIVILLGEGDAPEPYRILSWRDDFDQISAAGN
jgi:hypothetical protein